MDNIFLTIAVTFFAGMGAGLGTGFAGMSAAVEASLAGARVIVQEKHSATGGGSSICSGNFY